MKEKNKRFLISGSSGAIGGAFGVVSGSNSLVITGIVSAVVALLIVFSLNETIK
tara:strand:- start:15339 stop:15500 length:162 start_codon:yes stop_codon:yes gene_type:complete